MKVPRGQEVDPKSDTPNAERRNPLRDGVSSDISVASLRYRMACLEEEIGAVSLLLGFTFFITGTHITQIAGGEESCPRI